MTEAQLETWDPEPRLLQTDLGPVSVSEEGEAHLLPLICVHGIPGSIRDFRYLAPYLGKDFRIVRLEMPGFGHSPLGRVETVDGWSDIIVAVADALSLPEFALLAHSFGGGAAILTASRYQDRMTGLVLLASMAHRRHKAFGAPSQFFRAFALALAFPPTRGLALAAARHQYESRGLKAPSRAQWRALYRQLRIIGSVSFQTQSRALANPLLPGRRVLVCHAEDDHLVEIAITRELLELQPHAQGIIFPHGGHQLQKTRARDVGEAVVELFG